MFRASSLPGKPGRFRASNYFCSSEHTCIGCIAQIPRFRAVPSFSEPCILARNTASMHSSEQHFYAQLGTLLLCIARNNPSLPVSMHSSEPCFYVQLRTLLLCLARNNTSLPPSMHSSEPCFYAQLGTLLLCTARNTVSMYSLEHCFYA